MELPTGTRLYLGIWAVAFHAINHAFFVAVASGSCAPYPVGVRIGNVTLSNDSNARGVAMSVGTPEQDMAFVPQWNLNNTMLYGSSALCCALSNGSVPWPAESCITMRGGQYDPFNSKTRTGVAPNAYPVDSPPYPGMSFVADTVRVNDNVSLYDLPLGIAQNCWDDQGDHPQMAIGMGMNSTFMSALVSSGMIATRAWSIFWGRQGATRNTQLDGSMVFGGYDRAKVTGTPLTQQLGPQQWDRDNMKCPTGMTVYVSDLILNFGDGTDVSLFSNDTMDSEFQYQEPAHKFPACIIPNAPYLMTLPLSPYFENFRHYTSIFVDDRSFGINFNTMRYNLDDTPYRGDLTINIEPSLSIRIPNDQLVVPEKHINSETGQWIVEDSCPNLVISLNDDVNLNDLPILGRLFLTAAYLSVNEKKNEFSLWAANPTEKQDLVAFDSEGEETENFSGCGTTTSHDTSNGGVSTGAIAGIIIGVIIVLAAAVSIGFWLKKRRRSGPKAPELEAREPPELDALSQVEDKGSPPIYAPTSDLCPKAELGDSRAERMQNESPKPHMWYELAGS
ncbi:aspartic peptidase domain-containing protein [Lasiosphaeria hispida]|uniref:Aspartic peptidase domain-containing protein n=1 Tax=Lasiosphaeria hispida TaxID=260671 RepID=A0AAJ0MIQ0_9PEZI|nr:aspartic peptidase domain-containing protein [Lasiosphaeria hispida]